MLKSMLQISGGVDCEISRRWILSALQDPCLEGSDDARKAFVALSMLHPPTPRHWWEVICNELRPEVSRDLKRLLDAEVARQQEQVAVAGGREKGKM